MIFLHRINSKVKFLMQEFSLPPLSVLLCKTHLSWMGHLARSSLWCPPLFLQCWRDAKWWASAKFTPGRARHVLRGRQVEQSSDGIFHDVGPEWLLVAQSRAAWRDALSLRLEERFPRCTRDARKMLEHTSMAYSNKLLDLVGNELPRTTSARIPLVLLSDCETLVLQVCGKASVSDKDPYVNAAVKRVRWFLYFLEHRLIFTPALPEEGMCVFRGRGFNTLADAVCNSVMDERQDLIWYNPVFCDVSGCHLYVSCDGALRSDGMAACAAVLECHVPELQESAVIASAGRLLHVHSSYEAELEGYLCACELLLDFCKRLPCWRAC